MKKEIKLLMFFIEKKRKEKEKKGLVKWWSSLPAKKMIIPERLNRYQGWLAIVDLKFRFFFSLSRFWDHSYVLLVDIFAN